MGLVGLILVGILFYAMGAGWWVVGVVGAAVLIVGVQSLERRNKRSGVRDTIAKVPGFRPDKILIGDNGSGGVAIDSAAGTLCLVREVRGETQWVLISPDKVLSVEVYEDGGTVTNVDRSSQVGGMIVGGLLAGTAGAMVGGLSGRTDSSAVAHSLELRIGVDDAQCPMFDIALIVNAAGTGWPKNSPGYRTRLQNAREWAGMIRVMKHRADKQAVQVPTAPVPSPVGSVATEVRKLADLRSEGLLSQEEFDAAKRRLLSGGSVEPGDARAEGVAGAERVSSVQPAPSVPAVPPPGEVTYEGQRTQGGIERMQPPRGVASHSRQRERVPALAGAFGEVSRRLTPAQPWIIGVLVALSLLAGGYWLWRDKPPSPAALAVDEEAAVAQARTDSASKRSTDSVTASGVIQRGGVASMQEWLDADRVIHVHGFVVGDGDVHAWVMQRLLDSASSAPSGVLPGIAGAIHQPLTAQQSKQYEHVQTAIGKGRNEIEGPSPAATPVRYLDLRIPRSSPGDKGQYYLLSMKRTGDMVMSLHKRDGPSGPGYTKRETNCRTMMVRDYGYGEESPTTLEERDRVWYEIERGSSTYDIARFVCSRRSGGGTR